jgi:LmbE family N-acetylglucosaminyl deacetylase
MMKIWRVLALGLVLSLGAAAQDSGALPVPKADDRLKADVLLIVAHPDDETGVSAYLAQLLDQGKRVAAVYLTHGEAGHNNMGRERGPSLGAAREMELRHAMAQLGVQNVWFLDGKDTPSQDVLQSLANWHHGTNLEDVVRMVRITRPSVLITWLPAIFIGENHGDHQAAGVLAVEAFDSAGDPSVFPAQIAQPRKVNETLLEGMAPWQPQKIYFFSDASDDKQFKGKGPEYPTTAVSPTRHLPYWRIAMEEFRFHLTQYRSYIDKLGGLNEEQLTKLAGADQDGWSGPVQLIFGKSVVSGTATGDVLEGIKPGSLAFVRPPASSPLQHSGLSIEIGGPWHFYENFRRAHDLTQMPKAETPEISVAAGTILQLPVILRNDGGESAEITLSATVPDGWALKNPLARYQLAPGDVYPLEVELTTPSKKSDQVSEVACRAEAAGREIGTVRLRVRVGSGGLPQ